MQAYFIYSRRGYAVPCGTNQPIFQGCLDLPGDLDEDGLFASVALEPVCHTVFHRGQACSRNMLRSWRAAHFCLFSRHRQREDRSDSHCRRLPAFSNRIQIAICLHGDHDSLCTEHTRALRVQGSTKDIAAQWQFCLASQSGSRGSHYLQLPGNTTSFCGHYRRRQP